GLQKAISPLAQAHVELQVHLEKKKRKRLSRDKLFVRMWKRIMKILNTLSPNSKMPRVIRENIKQFSFLCGFKDEEADEHNGSSDEASS
ncbi:hypothetical protein HAX54_003018, partial [Datura stramonium]|nr:hypothetical protein [Datura stramonium]